MLKYTNEEVADLIVERIKYKIADYYPEFKKTETTFKRRPIEIRDWSFIFSVDVIDNHIHKLKTIFTKIPKTNRNAQSLSEIVNDEEAKKQTYREYITLKKLNASHSNASTLKVIRPLDCFDDLGALILEGFSERNLYVQIRANRKKSQTEQFQDILFRCGRWLAKVHKTRKMENNNKPIKERFLQSLRHYQYPICQTPKLYQRIHVIADKYVNRHENKFHFSKVIDGFEIRNILIGDREAGVMDLREKKGFLHDDIARFIISIKIVYWGTFWFILKRQPDPFYIKAFLKGYRSVLDLSDSFMQLFLLKEMLHQYSNAYSSLSDKQFSTYIQKVVEKIYVDRFYQYEIKKILTQMEHS